MNGGRGGTSASVERWTGEYMGGGRLKEKERDGQQWNIMQKDIFLPEHLQ